MKNSAVFIFAIAILVFLPALVYAQTPELATYRETAHVLIDRVLQNQTGAFITLSTVSNLEMRVPTDLDNAIHSAKNVTSVSLSNSPSCAIASTAHFQNGTAIAPTQSCVIITIMDQSLIDTHDLKLIQNKSQAIGDSMIGKVDRAFSIAAQPWQVYVRPVPRHELSSTPGATSAPTANASINVVYTFPYSKTSYLFDSISSVLLPDQIKGAGGFYDAARQMGNYNDSSMTFEILPQQNNTSLYQLQVARYYPATQDLGDVKPLNLLGISQLNRSSYFNVGFFPLNSLLEVTEISKNDVAVTSHGGSELPTEVRGGQKVPTDLTHPGWIFDPQSGKQIFAVYLFGKSTSANDSDLSLTIGLPSQVQENSTSGGGTPTTAGPDSSIYVIIGIVVAGGAAIFLFTRRR